MSFKVRVWFEDLGLFVRSLCLVTEQLFCCMCVWEAINSLLYLLVRHEQHYQCAGRSCCKAILMISRSTDWWYAHHSMFSTTAVQLNYIFCICPWKWFFLNDYRNIGRTKIRLLSFEDISLIIKTQTSVKIMLNAL